MLLVWQTAPMKFLAVVVMFALASCGGSPDVINTGPASPSTPNPHVYSSAMFVAKGIGWTSPKWNVALGVYDTYVTVEADTDERLVVKSARAKETILFMIKIDPNPVEQLRDGEIKTYRSIAGTEVVNVVGNNAMGKLLEQDTVGYSGAASNGSRFEQYLSRRGRCVFSFVVGIPGAKEDATIGRFSDELMRLRIRSIDPALGAGGALCEPQAPQASN